MAYDPNDPADKKIFDDAIAEATAGLTKKRDQLLDETKQLKEQIRKGASDPHALERLQEKYDALETQLETAQASLKETTKAATKTSRQLEQEVAFNRNLLVENGLTDALVKANVAKQFLPAVKALFSSKVEIKTEGDIRKAFIGDKPLEDAITAFAQSDEGKHYVAVGNNLGGNALGGGGAKATGKTMTRSAFDALPLAARPAVMAEGTNIVDG